MVYRTSVDAIALAPTGNLGSTTPTHRASHDQYRSAIVDTADYIDRITTTVVTSSGSGAYTLDASTGSVWDRTLTGNATITLSNPVTGLPITLILRQNATGSFTVAFATTIKWMNADPIWSGVASKIAGTATLLYVAGAWIGWYGGSEQ